MNPDGEGDRLQAPGRSQPFFINLNPGSVGDFDTLFPESDPAHVDNILEGLYGRALTLAAHRRRYSALMEEHVAEFGRTQAEFFSASGRISFGGLHTDHNGGLVLPACSNRDTLACVSARRDDLVHIISREYGEYRINLNDVTEPSIIKGTEGLVQGMAHYLRFYNYRVGGLNITSDSLLVPGVGQSTSASFENIIALAFSDFYNESRIPLIARALAGQYAENSFWGKKSGLLDQLGTGAGGAVFIDLGVEPAPEIVPVPDVDLLFARTGYRILLVDTRSGHAGKNEEYSKVPAEMFEVARFLHAGRLGKVSVEVFDRQRADIYREVGARPLLRALHFYRENDIVRNMKRALAEGDVPSFLALTNASCSNALTLLQNAYDITDPQHQEIPVAVSETRDFISRSGLQDAGACQGQGGGFGGSILTILRRELVPDYIAAMRAFNFEVEEYEIRRYGAVNVSRLINDPH